MKAIVRFMAFMAIVQGIIILVAQTIVSLLRLIFAVLFLATPDSNILFAIFFMVCIVLLVLMIIAFKNRDKLKAWGAMQQDKFKDKFMSKFNKRANKDKSSRSRARSMLEKMNPELMRKMSYAAYFGGANKMAGRLSKAAVATELTQTGLNTLDARKMKKIRDNEDLIRGFRVGKDAKGKDQFVDAAGNVVDAKDPENKDLLDRLKKNKDVLMRQGLAQDADGNDVPTLYDPLTKKLVDDESVYADLIGHQDHLNNLNSIPANRIANIEEHEQSIKRHEEGEVIRKYVDRYSRFMDGMDVGDPRRALLDNDELLAMYAANPDAYDRLLNNQYSDEDMEAVAGQRLNGRMRVPIPVVEEKEGVRTVVGLHELNTIDGNVISVRDSQGVLEAISERQRYADMASTSQAGLPADVAKAYDAGAINPEGIEDRDAKAHNETTRGNMFPDGVENPEDVEIATRGALDEHTEDMLNPQAAEGYNPDNVDFNAESEPIGGASTPEPQRVNTEDVQPDNSTIEDVLNEQPDTYEAQPDAHVDSQPEIQHEQVDTQQIDNERTYETPNYSQAEVMSSSDALMNLLGNTDEFMDVDNEQHVHVERSSEQADQALRSIVARGAAEHGNISQQELDDVVGRLSYGENSRSVLNSMNNIVKDNYASGMSDSISKQLTEADLNAIKKDFVRALKEDSVAKGAAPVGAVNEKRFEDAIGNSFDEIAQELMREHIKEADEELTEEEIRKQGEEKFM